MSTAEHQTPQDAHRGLTAIALILVIGGGIFTFIMFNPKKPKAKEKSEVTALVKLSTLKNTSHTILIPAQGTVEPACEATLVSQVSGEIRKVSDRFRPGGIFDLQETILQIDIVAARSLVSERWAAYARAKAELAAEESRVLVAKAELQFRSDKGTLTEKERNLIERQPQLDRAKEEVDAAFWLHELAVQNMQKCTYPAPYELVIRERFVNLGSYVTPQTPLAKVAAADRVWIRATVPVSQLPRVTVGLKDAVAIIAEGFPAAKGTIIEKLPDLERPGRLAQILIETTAFIPFGSVVSVELPAGDLKECVSIHRDHLHEGDTVYLASKDERLEIKPISVLWRERDHLLLATDGLDGRELIVNDIPNAMNGMKLKIHRAEDPKSATKAQVPK